MLESDLVELRAWAEAHAPVNMVQAKLVLQLLAAHDALAERCRQLSEQVGHARGRLADVVAGKDKAELAAATAAGVLARVRGAMRATGVFQDEQLVNDLLPNRVADLYERADAG